MKNKLLWIFLLTGLNTVEVNGQVTTGEGFETAVPPTGWITVGGGGFGGATWSRRTNATTGGTAAGTTPTVTTFSGNGMARFTCRNITAGQSQSLCSPVIDLSKRGSQNSYVTFRMYRDTIYNTADSVTVWFNTARNLTGAKRIGGIARYAKNTYPDSVAQGWHRYSFAIPSSYTGTTNYFLIQGTARGGANAGNIFIDSVEWDAFPTYCEGVPTPGSITASQYKICGNSAFVQLRLNGHTTATGSSFIWQLSSDSSTFNTNNGWNNNASPQGNFTRANGLNRWIRVIVSCSQSGKSDTSDLIKIYFVDGTAPTITVTPNNPAVCAGGSTPAKIYARGAETYTWSPTTGLNTATGDTVYALPSATTFYTVTGVDSLGCSGQAFFQVQVQNGPNVNLTAADTLVCQGDSTLLTAAVTGGPPNATYTYSWSNGGSTRTTMGTAVAATNSFTVSVKNAAGCETIKSVNVASALKPAAAMSYTVVSGRTVQFKFAGSNAADVYWNYSDGNESYQQEPTYTFSADGTYKVMVVANNPPCKSDTVYFNVTVAASNSVKTAVLNQFVLMPNPTQGIATVRFAGVEKHLNIKVVDATGKVVLTQSLDNVVGEHGAQISLQHLTPGLYHVIVKSSGGESRSNLQIIR